MSRPLSLLSADQPSLSSTANRGRRAPYDPGIRFFVHRRTHIHHQMPDDPPPPRPTNDPFVRLQVVDGKHPRSTKSSEPDEPPEFFPSPLPHQAAPATTKQCSRRCRQCLHPPVCFSFDSLFFFFGFTQLGFAWICWFWCLILVVYSIGNCNKYFILLLISRV
jgi:hypothetical protein